MVFIVAYPNSLIKFANREAAYERAAFHVMNSGKEMSVYHLVESDTVKPQDIAPPPEAAKRRV